MPFATVVSGYTGFVKGFVDALSYPCGCPKWCRGWSGGSTSRTPGPAVEVQRSAGLAGSPEQTLRVVMSV